MATSLLTVSWKEHSCEVAEVFRNLLAEDYLVDCTIAAEGKKLKAHRLILSACSPYFQMLFSEEAEKHPIVILKDILFDTLKAVVDFVYSGEIQIPESQLQSFLALAKSLQIKGLNNSPLKDRNKKLSPSVIVNVSQCLSKGSRSTYGVQDTIVISEGETEISSQHHPHLYPSGGHKDAVQSNSSVSFEGHRESCEEVQSASLVTLPGEQWIIPGCVDHSVDADVTVKHEPLYSVFVETNTEVLDDTESDEHISGNFTSEMDKGTNPAFRKQGFNQSSTLAEANELTAQWQRSEVELLRGVASASEKPLSQEHPGPPPPQVSTHSHIAKRARTREICGVSFNFSGNLTNHNSTHTGERPHKCDICGDCFTQRCNLVRHKRKHTGERPYPCDACGDSFARQSHLVRHRRRHTGERPYRCDICGDSFTQSGALSRHKRIHTREKPFRSDVCGKTFSNSFSFKNHNCKK